MAAILTLTNCAKEIDSPIQETPVVNDGIPFEIIAMTNHTKTTNDNLTTQWVAGDQINVWHADASSATYNPALTSFTIEETDVTNGRFTGSLNTETPISETNDWYFFYPYNEYNKTPAGNSGDNFSYQSIAQSYSGSQTQTGNDNMSHLAGKNFPLYGKTKSVSSGGDVSAVMDQVVSVVRVTVTNNTNEPLIVNKVTFTSSQDIVGTFYVDFTGETLSFNPRDGYTNKTATLNITNGVEIAKEGKASFYLGVKPFTQSSGEIVVTVNSLEKSIPISSDVTFASGKIKTINFNYNEISETPTVSLLWSEDFSGETPLSTYTTSGEVSIASSDAYAGGEKPELFMKGTASFSATINVKDAQRNLTLVFNTNKVNDSDLSLGVSAGATLSTDKGNKNQKTSVYNIELDQDTESLVITWSSSDNSRVDNIMLMEGTMAMQTLSFSPTECSVIFGEDFEKPELTGAMTTLTYSSSEENVATVDQTTGEVTIKAAGTTTITATAEATSEYFAATASYTLTVSEPSDSKQIKYTITSTTSVDVTGNSIEGSSATYSSTYTSKCQLTAEHSMTLTLTGFDGLTITGIILNMKSNKSSGAGYYSMLVGDSVISSIGSSDSGINFNDAAWNEAWSTSYVDVTPTVTSTEVGVGETVTVTIAATVNSLYCLSITILYK